MKLSIIIPVYNVEGYIARCVKSLEDQDIPRKDYEIIIVNDGSPDNSRGVVLQLMEEFNNIVLIEQINKGVSLARNAGMERAKGEYMLFVDPDDYVQANTLKDIFLMTESKDLEVLFLGFNFLDFDGKILKRVYNEAEAGKSYAGIEAYHVSRGDGKTDPDRAWAVLVKTSLIRKFALYYAPKIPYLEDGEFMARTLCVAERCEFFGKLFYQRTSRLGSATRSSLFYSEKAINGFILAAKNLISFRENNQLNDDQKKFLNQPICKFILLVLIPFCKFSKIKEFNRFHAILKAQGLTNCNLAGCNNYYRIEGFFYNLSPYAFFVHRYLKSPLLKLVKP
jgi:glycosyltransferase involved in cell wall biosynthesis